MSFRFYKYIGNAGVQPQNSRTPNNVFQWISWNPLQMRWTFEFSTSHWLCTCLSRNAFLFICLLSSIFRVEIRAVFTAYNRISIRYVAKFLIASAAQLLLRLTLSKHLTKSTHTHAAPVNIGAHFTRFQFDRMQCASLDKNEYRCKAERKKKIPTHLKRTKCSFIPYTCGSNDANKTNAQTIFSASAV